jgi:hypothetical protein
MFGRAKASTKVVDALAISKSIVRNTVGSGGFVEIDRDEGKTLASAMEPLSIYLGGTGSGGWDLRTRYDCEWLRLIPSS